MIHILCEPILSIKSKTIALCFGENFPNFIDFQWDAKNVPNLMWANFEEKSKAIALLFGENLPTFIDLQFGTKNDPHLM